MRESPSRKHLGVAVVTTRRNLGAAGHRIPRRVGPLYPGLQSHGLTLREDAPLTRTEAEFTTQRSDRTGSRLGARPEALHHRLVGRHLAGLPRLVPAEQLSHQPGHGGRPPIAVAPV